jgi:hypothetical protein
MGFANVILSSRNDTLVYIHGTSYWFPELHPALLADEIGLYSKKGFDIGEISPHGFGFLTSQFTVLKKKEVGNRRD